MSATDDTVTLTTNGQIWSGWTSISISSGIEAAAGKFDLGLTERWPGQQAARSIQPGATCSVAIGGSAVITGYVDTVSPSYDSQSHQIKVTGRDAVGDLVDCSATNAQGRWASALPLTIAAGIVSPFGLAVTSEVDLGPPLTQFSLQMGETAWEAIERLARYVGALATSSDSGVKFIRAGSSGRRASLKLGRDILKAGAEYDFKNRYSEVIVLGQSAGSDYIPPAQSAGGKATSKDPNVTRFRPKIVMAEMAATGANFQTRADWEQAVKAGRSRKLELTVQGWRDAEGSLWAANTTVQVDDDFLDAHDTYLISEVRFTKDDKGTLAVLSLMPPSAFTPEPVPDGGFMQDAGGLRVSPPPGLLVDQPGRAP